MRSTADLAIGKSDGAIDSFSFRLSGASQCVIFRRRVSFGESTLNFELRFWLDVARANSAQVASDLRLMIAGSFAEQGLVIAFPQRDVNLQLTRPIPVAVVAADSQAKNVTHPNPAEVGAKPAGIP